MKKYVDDPLRILWIRVYRDKWTMARGVSRTINYPLLVKPLYFQNIRPNFASYWVLSKYLKYVISLERGFLVKLHISIKFHKLQWTFDKRTKIYDFLENVFSNGVYFFFFHPHFFEILLLKNNEDLFSPKITPKFLTIIT